MKLAPVILFTFNRPVHTEKTLQALCTNNLAQQTDIFIFSDGPRNEDENKQVTLVRNLINNAKWKNNFQSVTVNESQYNKGLATSVKDGVTQVFENYDSVIVLEDDLVSSSDFLDFMNENLTHFRENEKIGSISAYNPLKEMPPKYPYDIYFSPRSGSLGWGTWKNVWQTVDWDAIKYNTFKINYKLRSAFNIAGYDRAKRLDLQMKKDAQSWSIIFGFDLFINNKYTVYAVASKLVHIGWDGSGTHSSGDIEKFNDKLSTSNYPLRFPDKVELDKKVMRSKRTLFGGGVLVRVKDLVIHLKNRWI